MFTVNRKELLRELLALQIVMEKKGTIPILSFVKFECGEVLTLTATDLDATLISKISFQGEPWSGCVPLVKLLALVRLLEGDEVQCAERNGNRLELSCDRSKHLLPIAAVTDFPETVIPKGEKATLDGATLARMVKATSFWTLTNRDTLKPSEQKYTGLSIQSNGEAVEVMSFNQKAAAIATLSVKCPEFNFILPRQAVAVLGRLGEELQVTWDSERVMFSGTSQTLIARTFIGEFPAWRAFLPAYDHKVQVPEDFRRAVQRAVVTSDARGGFFPSLKLTLAKSFIKLESQGDDGQGEEVFQAESTLNGTEIVMGVNGSQLLEALAAIESETTCEFTSAEQPLILIPANEGFDLRYLTMPCRLNF